MHNKTASFDMLGAKLLAFQNKRFIFLLCFTIVIALGFWGLSRYPQLAGKVVVVQTAEQVGVSPVQDMISSKAVYQYEQTDSFYEKTIATAGNWYWANWRGMSFGIVLGAALLSILKVIRWPESKNPFLNTLQGLIMGVPLGICSNCVSPVARGLLKGGARLETALAMMVSSPTLNIMVLVMLFSILPLKVALVKLVLTLVLIFAIIPFISLQRVEVKQANQEDGVCALGGENKAALESWYEAFRSSSIIYGRNLFYLVTRMLPLMILAGLLGAALSHAFALENYIGNEVTLLLLSFAAVIGTLLPVPMGFDVMLAQSLLMAGLSMAVVTTLLFTLGAYSILSFMVLTRAASLKVAAQIFCSVSVLGLLAGGLMLFI